MAGKRKTLTIASSVEAVRAAPGRQIDVPDNKVPGLSLRVSVGRDGKPKRRWSLRYRNAAGQQRRLHLGDYPDLGLSKAREVARAVGVAIDGGADPSGARQAARASRKAGTVDSVADLIDAYLAAAERGRHRPNAKPKRPRSLAQDVFYARKYIVPKFGKLPLGELRRGQIQAFVDNLPAPSSAFASRALLRAAYNFAIRNELTTGNPASLVALPAPGQRERVLRDDEMRLLWAGCEDLITARMPDATTALAIQLAAICLQRGNEVAGIHSRELDRQSRTWTLPGERAKNGRLHLIPLSDAAVAILDTVYGGTSWAGFAFPSRAGRANQHLLRPTLTKCFQRIAIKAGVTDARLHDLRRTGSSALTGLGVPRMTVSKILNHSDAAGASKTTQVYDRFDYWEPKKRGLELWADHLTAMVSGRQRAENVVNLRA